MKAVEALQQLSVDLDADVELQNDGPYIATVTTTGEAIWLIVVPEGKMHGVEVALGTR